MRAAMSSRVVLSLTLLAAGACTEDSDSGDSDAQASTSEAATDATDAADDSGEESTGAPVYEGPSSVDDPACQEDYALCGDLLVPADFSATPRSLAVALYTSVPPLGPPDAILAQIDAPDLQPGHRFPVVLGPVLETGDYFVWLNVYVEGGGMFIPVNGVDYMGSTDAAVTLDGSAKQFGEIELTLASGF